MTRPSAQPSQATLDDLAIRVAALRGQVRQINTRLDQAGIHGNLNLAAQFEQLARQVRDALDTPALGGPAAPYWIGLDQATRDAQLNGLRDWVNTVLRPNYGGYELRDCWDNHIHAIWELSTLAAEWHRTYQRNRPDLTRALEFYDRWLPGTMRRLTDITRRCTAGCVTTNPQPWQPQPRP